MVDIICMLTGIQNNIAVRENNMMKKKVTEIIVPWRKFWEEIQSEQTQGSTKYVSDPFRTNPKNVINFFPCKLVKNSRSLNLNQSNFH